MPEDPQDSIESAERDAALASAYFDKLIALGKSEQIAAQLTSAYILGRIRRDAKREPWELGDDPP